jgi:hypothetical protein
MYPYACGDWNHSFKKNPVSLSFQKSHLPSLIMPGHSPKRKDSPPKNRIINKNDEKTGSDYRLFIVLLAAIVLAIVIIFTIMLTTQ